MPRHDILAFAIYELGGIMGWGLDSACPVQVNNFITSLHRLRGTKARSSGSLMDLIDYWTQLIRSSSTDTMSAFSHTVETPNLYQN